MILNLSLQNFLENKTMERNFPVILSLWDLALFTELHLTLFQGLVGEAIFIPLGLVVIPREVIANLHLIITMIVIV